MLRLKKVELVMHMIAVSACLMGTQCRYNGASALNGELFDLLKDKDVLLFCPEVMASLPTPRNPAEIRNGNGGDVIKNQAVVIDKNGKNMTGAFVNGAVNTMSLFSKCDVSVVILKDKSPSCGVEKIYDGSFSETLIDGHGVLTAFLLQNDTKIFVDTNINDVKRWLTEKERMGTYE